MWWLFFAFFALSIGGIQTLGWWSSQAQAQPAFASGDDFERASIRHRNNEATHWRSAFLQQ